MTNTKTLIVMAGTVVCASLLLLGGGLERIGQVALSVYAVVIFLTIFVKHPGPSVPFEIKILARSSFLYVVAAAAYTEHMVIAFVLAISWVLVWLHRGARKAEEEKSGA